MILSSIYNKLSSSYKKDIVAGLAAGLFGGLVIGLVAGLVDGLVYGLVAGLVYGLVAGLAAGLFGGLVVGLVIGLVAGLVYGLVAELAVGFVVILIKLTEALPFINGVIPILLLIFGIILFVEIFYWLSPKEKVKKKDLIKHTLSRKGEALLEVLMIFSAITQIYVFTREIDFVRCFPEILKWTGYVGVGIISLGLIILIGYGFIKLNSMKYSRC